MQINSIKYVHTENTHNFRAAEQVVPFIIQLLQPASVVDVGCGTGTWLKVFSDNGVGEILGIDGDYVDKTMLHVAPQEFREYDLEEIYTSDRKFDLAISLEVAEHLKKESAEIFVKTLTGLSDVVLFSAAIPGQGGQNHLNEQPPQYWIQKFRDEGFQVYDMLRPIFWENTTVDFWYRQNMLLFTKKPELATVLSGYPTFLNAHIVPPDVLQIRNKATKRNNELISGQKEFKVYIKLLLKYFKNKF